jgi:hypothetical protein
MDDLTALQVAMLQSLDDARRAGLVSDVDADVIERAIRDFDRVTGTFTPSGGRARRATTPRP